MINSCKKVLRRGFTLIELLVVISIIGLLSSVILAGLRSARIKSINGRIQQEVITLRNQIELSYDGAKYPVLSSDVERFVVVPTFNATIQNTVNDLVKISPGSSYGGGVAGGSDCGTYSEANISTCSGTYLSTTNSLTIFANVECPSSGPVTSWAIYAAFYPTGTAGYFCVDSTKRVVSSSTGKIPSWTAGDIPTVPVLPTSC